jgi:hypothetical protein
MNPSASGGEPFMSQNTPIRERAPLSTRGFQIPGLPETI